MGAFLFLVLIIAGIVGLVLFSHAFKKPPSGMSKENKAQFESSMNSHYLIGFVILIVVLMLLGF